MTLKTKATQSFEISEAVYQSTRPEPRMFGIFIKTAVISSEHFISATVSRQRKKQENIVAMVVLRSFRINTNFYHVP
jgi:hypothetical protein